MALGGIMWTLNDIKNYKVGRWNNSTVESVFALHAPNRVQPLVQSGSLPGIPNALPKY